MKTREIRSFEEVDISELRQPIICVYRYPEDYRNKCVARIFDGVRPTNIVITRNTVEQIREDIKKMFSGYAAVCKVQRRLQKHC